MFPLSKKERIGRNLALVLLGVPLAIMLMLLMVNLIRGNADLARPEGFLTLGGLFGAWSILSLLTYMGKVWAKVFLLVLALFLCSSVAVAIVAGEDLSRFNIWLVILSGSFYLLPPVLLFLPAPRAFFRYQRQKNQRQQQALEAQLNQIGEENE